MVNVATHRQIATVLEEMSRDVEALGAALCVDMTIAMRHVDTLQAIDLIAQKQRSLAAAQIPGRYLFGRHRSASRMVQFFADDFGCNQGPRALRRGHHKWFYR